MMMAGFASVLATGPAMAGDWRSLFNGQNLDGWEISIDGQPSGEDPDGLVKVRDGAIHMYRNVEEGQKAPFGVITSEGDFSHFHFRFEYRWGGKRFAPRAEALRDAGLIYHVREIDRIWPAGLECQVQEGDTGDLVFIRCGGLSWMRPAGSPAPEGQGEPGLLPESGGVPGHFPPSSPYLGRFEEADSPTGWNRVEVIVHGDESAVHIVNGRTIARLANFTGQDGTPLTSGKLCLQLEGAEILYRNLEIRELDEPARPDQRALAFSAVKGQPARPRTLSVTNPGASPLAGFRITGSDAEAFEILTGPDTLAVGATGEWTLAFHPHRGRGRYSAALESTDPSTGCFVLLQGIGLDAFEGENEPPLQEIVTALGIPVDVGGRQLSLDRDAEKIGDGTAAAYFVPAGNGPITLTPLARFSPPGEVPFGYFLEGDSPLVELGKLADSSTQPDAHQSLEPPITGGSVSIEMGDPGKPFGFYLKGHYHVSHTDANRPTEAKIAHTARVYPVTVFKGRVMENSWLVGFEEASNGDYQDALFLVEGIKPAP